MKQSDGLPDWNGHYGASIPSNIEGRKWAYHPTLKIVCGLMAGSKLQMGFNCDLDLSQNSVIVDGGPDTPYDSNFYWSLFSFCWDVTPSPTPLPPVFTKVISSSDDQPFGGTQGAANAWCGADVLVQVFTRQTLSVGFVQALQWPDSGIFPLISPIPLIKQFTLHSRQMDHGSCLVLLLLAS